MHTVIVIGIGLVLLGVCLALARFMDKSLAIARSGRKNFNTAR